MQPERINYKGSTLLPVKKDLVFKAVFASGSNFELLASLLSSILNIELSAQDITVTNTELPPDYEKGKLSRLDVRIKTGDGKHINVEIQIHDRKDIEKRSLFYLSKLYTEQMSAGMKFKDICPAIAINILDFNFLPYAEYHNRYRMKHIGTQDELTDVFEINFIELKKVKEEKTDNMKELWMQYLSADREEVLDMLREKSPVLEKAVDKLIYVSADEQLRYELDMREKAELDYWSDMATSREEGLEQGLKEGEAKGREEEKLNFAKSLLADGITIDKIIQYTGLTKGEIEKLK